MRCLVRAQQRARHSLCRLVQRRQLCNTPHRQTDGVFRALTEQRMQVPWIEAFRKQQHETANKSQREPPAPAQPDLTPKKMADSYHSVVSAASSVPMSRL